MAFWLAVPPPFPHFPYFPISKWGEFYSDDIFTCQPSTFRSLTLKNNHHCVRRKYRGRRECGRSVSISQLQMHYEIGEMDTWAKITCRIRDLYKWGCLCNIHHSHFPSRGHPTVWQESKISFTRTYIQFSFSEFKEVSLFQVKFWV